MVPEVLQLALKTVLHPKEIADSTFYKELYKDIRSKTKNSNPEAFLSSLHLPSLSGDEASQMISENTKTEIQDAIKKKKNINKSPRTDRLPREYTNAP